MTHRALSKQFATAAVLLVTVPFIGFSLGQTHNNEFPPLVSTVTPRISRLAVAARLRGNVVVELTLASDGKVISAQAVAGHPILQEPSRQAALNWRFAPALGASRVVRLVFVYPELARLAYGDPSSLTVLPYGLELELSLPGSLTSRPETESHIPVDWRPGTVRCRIHRKALKKDRVEIVYGLLGFREGYLRQETVCSRMPTLQFLVVA
jgi:TonB family protein